MSKIISTIGSSHRIEQVISEAREFIVIVTPYLKITASIFSRIMQADKRNVNILFLYGKKEITNDEKEKILTLKNCNLYYLDNLHAKCYFNESFGVISSMNLYEYSQVNNWELGVAYDDEEDNLLKEQLYGEVDLMLKSATIKKESFKNFTLVKKKYIERLSEYLNTHFTSERFSYYKEFNDLTGQYNEHLETEGFPKDFINLSITNNGTRIYFTLNLSENQTNQLKSKLNFKVFEDEYRIYHNRPDIISVYCSIFHREKWETYTDKFRFEYITKIIERMTGYLDKVLRENK